MRVGRWIAVSVALLCGACVLWMGLGWVTQTQEPFGPGEFFTGVAIVALGLESGWALLGRAKR